MAIWYAVMGGFLAGSILTYFFGKVFVSDVESIVKTTETNILNALKGGLNTVSSDAAKTVQKL